MPPAPVAQLLFRANGQLLEKIIVFHRLSTSPTAVGCNKCTAESFTGQDTTEFTAEW